MNDLIDIFNPYLPFITMLVSIIVNGILAFRGAKVFAFIVANTIIALVITTLGLNPFNMIVEIVSMFLDLIISVLEAIWDAIW